MKRKITWMCILALILNNVCFSAPVNVWAEEDIPAETTEAVEEDGERPEGVESVTVPTDAAEIPDERPEGVEPVTVPTDAAEIPDERPEGVESVTVPTDAAEIPDERPEGVEPVTVPTDAAKEPENEPVSGNGEGTAGNGPEGDPVSGNEAVSENDTVSGNETVSGDETGVVSENGTETKPENVFSVEMPASPEGRNSFDYILDPDGLIEKTGAKHYGGREFQKGAQLFFINNKEMGDGTVSACFSGNSDKKTIVNRGSMPVSIDILVTLSSSASGNDVMKISGDPSFEGIDQPALSFSLTDGEGNQTLMNEEGEISTGAVLEEEGEYSFTLTGTANTKADWSGVTGGPSLNVSWTVKPLETGEETKEEAEGSQEEANKEQDNKEETEDAADEEPEDSTSENSASENGVSENEAPEVENSEDTSGEDEERPSLSGSESGVCVFEGVAENGPYSVILPAAHEDMYSFIMDPQKLIDASEGAAYPGMTFEKGKTLYFKNTGKDAAFDLSSQSDRQVIINNGSKPLKVSVSVSIATKDGLALSPVEDFAGYRGSQIYLSIVSGNGEKLKNVSYLAKGVSVDTVIPPAEADAFDIDWNEERGYFRVPISKEEGKEVTLPEFSFRITGGTNEKASWDKLWDDKVKLNVVWSVKELDEMPQEAAEEELPEEGSGETPQ